jgi:GMP synthase (glutamine-hydrolysing)
MGSYEIALSEGAASDSLLAGAPPRFDAILTHRQTVLSLPTNAVALGRSKLDRHQTILLGARASYVQFHPEMTPELIKMYIHARAADLEVEGFDVPATLARVTAAPHARRDLLNFVKEAIGLKVV